MNSFAHLLRCRDYYAAGARRMTAGAASYERALNDAWLFSDCLLLEVQAGTASVAQLIDMYDQIDIFSAGVERCQDLAANNTRLLSRINILLTVVSYYCDNNKENYCAYFINYFILFSSCLETCRSHHFLFN